MTHPRSARAGCPLAVAGNARWLAVLTLALFAVPVLGMRRRLVA